MPRFTHNASLHVLVAVAIAVTASLSAADAWADAPADASSSAAHLPQVRVTSDIAYKYSGGPFGRQLEVGLWAGSYVLEKTDADGRYYLATKPSFWWKNGTTYVLFKAAGLWLPNDPSKDVRIYFYNYGGHVAGSSLDDLRSKADAPAAGESYDRNPSRDFVVETTLRQQEQLPGGYTPKGILATALATSVIATLIEAGSKGPMLHQLVSPDFTRHVRERLILED